MEIRRDVFQAIADPTRRAILLLLAVQPMTAGSIATNFDSSRPTVSKHVKVLTECELVKSNQKGREIYYEIDTSNLQEIDIWLEQVRTLWENRFHQLDAVLANLKKKEK